jgi:hypothetical protein
MLLKKNIAKVFHAYRVTLEELYSDLLMGDRLDSYLVFGDWTMDFDRSRAAKTTIEKYVSPPLN